MKSAMSAKASTWDADVISVKNGKPVLSYKGEEEFLDAYQTFYGKFVKK
jgi:hypothetical protein